MSRNSMKKISFDIDDDVFKRIKNKFNYGIFTEGNNLKFETRVLSSDNPSDYKPSELSDELYANLMESGLYFFDVPENFRTSKFYISQFLDEEVYSYIEKHVEKFDRQFFKDLITTSEYSIMLPDSNAFLIMPLEYIDEEMCSLAMIHSTWLSSGAWFEIVQKRKPSVLTKNMWKLAARLYCNSNNAEVFLKSVPSEYMDFEFYYELCQCSFFKGSKRYEDKKNIMSFIPIEFRKELAVKLYGNDSRNIISFSNEVFEMDGNIFSDSCELHCPLWMFLLRLDKRNVKHVPLNSKRIDYFIELYKDDISALSNVIKPSFDKYLSTCSVDELCDSYLPVESKCSLPIVLKEYNSRDHLLLLYKSLGISILGKLNDLFYYVKLPDGWTINTSDNNFVLVDNDGNEVLKFIINRSSNNTSSFVTMVSIPRYCEYNKGLLYSK